MTEDQRKRIENRDAVLAVEMLRKVLSGNRGTIHTEVETVSLFGLARLNTAFETLSAEVYEEIYRRTSANLSGGV